MHEDGARVHGKVQEGDRAERDNGARGRCTGAREGAGNGAASDNGARGRCTGVRGGAGRGPGQSAITVHGDGVYG